jgi:hypothetical protein
MSENIPDTSDTTEFQHSLLCILTLPRSRQPSREYIREYQGKSLVLEAGTLWDGQKWTQQLLPYGPKARLAFMHICSEAVKTQSRYIEIERSARAFMSKIGLDDQGNNYRLFRQQMNALAACRFRLGYTSSDGKAGTLDVKPIEKFEAWTVNEGGQPVLWASDLILGDAFFNDLIKHAAPLSGKAIRDLSGSALALDWYGLLAYRLHSLEKPIFVSWDQMRDQIGQEYKQVRSFKQQSLEAIKAVLEVYPSAKVEQVKGGLMLKPSPPPVAPKATGLERSLSKNVKASLPQPEGLMISLCHLQPGTIESFRKRYPRLDPYACEADFRHFLNTSAEEQPRNFDAAFLGFAKKWATEQR